MNEFSIVVWREFGKTKQGRYHYTKWAARRITQRALEKDRYHPIQPAYLVHVKIKHGVTI